MKRNDRGVVQCRGIVLVFARGNEEKLENPVKIIGVTAEIQTGFLLDRSQKLYRLSQLEREVRDPVF
jgi:hypothetical protein